MVQQNPVQIVGHNGVFGETYARFEPTSSLSSAKNTDQDDYLRIIVILLGI